MKAVEFALSLDMQDLVKKVKNPYGDGNTSKKIVDILERELIDRECNLKKKFYDWK